MKNLSLGILLILISGFGLTTAHAASIYYTIEFTSNPYGGSTPTSGAFTFNDLTPAFEHFAVVWEGVVFDLKWSANAPWVFGALSCLGGATGATATLKLMDGTCEGTWRGSSSRYGTYIALEAHGPDGDIMIDVIPYIPDYKEFYGSGEFIARRSVVPEPAPLTLCLSALLALAFVGRKRLVTSRGASN